MKYTKPEIEVFLLEQQIMTLETSGFAPEEGGTVPDIDAGGEWD